MKNIDSISSCLLIAAFLKHALAFPTTHIEDTGTYVLISYFLLFLYLKDYHRTNIY